MKNLTSSVYTFEKLIQEDFLYIDKSEYLWKLIEPGTGQYFMSRPRRFGKSLTVSTLKAIFSGKKELFQGLALYDKDYDWKQYPIVHIDFANYEIGTAEQLTEFLINKIRDIAALLQVELKQHYSMSGAAFTDLVNGIKQNKIVILVDEYDKPILGNVANPQINGILQVLKGFYSVIKATEAKQRFVFMTGVSKFSHVSIFSDLNNLTDITMRADFATMLGYTQEEFEYNFADRIEQLIPQLGVSKAELLDKIRFWYNGYRFHQNAKTVYNPVSLCQFFANGGEFKSFWFATGTPTFLLEFMKTHKFDFEKTLTQSVSELAFSAYEVNNIDPLALLLQTGYLTIHHTNEKFGKTFYHLDFPNFEVKSAFDTYLMNAYTDVSKEELENMAVNFADAIANGDVAGFMKQLKVFLANIPYDLQLTHEKYYQTIFFILFLMIGVYIEAEARTNDGRIDAVAAYGEWCYIFEFKLNQTAEIALAQIKTKQYYQKYQNSGKKIILVGANFDTETRQLGDYQSEIL